MRILWKVRSPNSKAKWFKRAEERKEAVCFSEELLKALLGFSHKGNHINVLQKALLSPNVIATEITIIVPIKVILNEQYVILMFQYLGEESV